MDARYVFRIEFRVEPEREVYVEPAQFETRMFRDADVPGDEGWLFFRDNLWRGEIGDESYFREMATDALGVPVVNVEYKALETDEEYYEALQEEIAANLDVFKADSTPEVLNKYLGSSVEVTREEYDESD